MVTQGTEVGKIFENQISAEAFVSRIYENFQHSIRKQNKTNKKKNNRKQAKKSRDTCPKNVPLNTRKRCSTALTIKENTIQNHNVITLLS